MEEGKVVVTGRWECERKTLPVSEGRTRSTRSHARPDTPFPWKPVRQGRQYMGSALWDLPSSGPLFWATTLHAPVMPDLG